MSINSNQIMINNQTKVSNWFAIGNALKIDPFGELITLMMTDFSVSRASSRTVWGYPADGIIADGQSLLTVPDDIMAFTGGRLLAGNVWSAIDADGTALTPAVSMADAGTNLLTYSEEINHTDWAKTGLNITGMANVTAAPDRNVTADQILPTGGASHFFYEAISRTSGLKYTTSIYAKQDGYSRIMIYDAAAATGRGFDLTNGTIFTVSGINDAATYGIESLGNGWYRCWITETATATALGNHQFYVIDGITFSFTADETSKIYCWGAQVEQSDYITPYIYTTAATATRAADIVTIPTPSVLSGATGAIEFTCTPSKTGQTAKYTLGSTVDATNLLAVEMNATTIDLVKKVANTDYSAQEAYTHAKDTKARIQIYWDSSGAGVRAADASADITALSFHTNANTLAMPLDTDFEIGNQGGVNLFVGDDPVDDFKFYASKSIVGWS